MTDDEMPEKVVDSLTVPTVYVDGIFGMEFRDGVAILNLTRHVFPAPNSELGVPFNQVVQRLAIPATAFLRFAAWFADSKDEMIKQGALNPIIKLDSEDEDG